MRRSRPLQLHLVKLSAVLVLLLALTGCGSILDRVPSGSPTQGEFPTTPLVATTTPTASATDAPVTTPGSTTPGDATSPTPSEEPTMTPGTASGEIDRMGYSADEIFAYFEEVALHAEFYDGETAPQELRRWKDEMVCKVVGSPTDEDYALLDRLFDSLNAIPHFPGICFENEENEANITLHFEGGDAYDRLAAEHVASATDGFATCWYQPSEYLYFKAEIGIRSDISQTVRNSVILEELIQTFGLMNDSYLHDDSIFYQDYNEPQWPSDLDWILIELLYRPELAPGMTVEECRDIVMDMLQ